MGSPIHGYGGVEVVADVMSIEELEGCVEDKLKQAKSIYKQKSNLTIGNTLLT